MLCKSRLAVKCSGCIPFLSWDYRGRGTHRSPACQAAGWALFHFLLNISIYAKEIQRLKAREREGPRGSTMFRAHSLEGAYILLQGMLSFISSICLWSHSLHLKYRRDNSFRKRSYLLSISPFFFFFLLSFHASKQFQFCGRCVHHSSGILASTKHALWHVAAVLYLFSFGCTMYHWLNRCPST